MNRPKRPTKPTLADVCHVTGLSSATVSRVLSGADNVRPDTKERVLKAVADLGYTPNHAARTLAGSMGNRQIGVVFPEIGNGFWADLLKGLDAAADDRGFHILTAFSHGDRDERDLALKLLNDGRIDALIVMNLRLGKDFVADACRPGVPLVLIDRPVDGGEAASISLDNQSGAASAMRHLLGHGYDEVLILAGDTDTYDARQRLKGCRDAVESLGHAWREDLVVASSFTEEGGRHALRKWMKRTGRHPRAIFGLNDNLALGALGYLKEAGLTVPHDTALVGFDDIDAARHVGLTTVTVPVQDMGAEAARTAIAAVLGERFHPRIVLPTKLTVRQSCGCVVPAERPADLSGVARDQ